MDYIERVAKENEQLRERLEDEMVENDTLRQACILGLAHIRHGQAGTYSQDEVEAALEYALYHGLHAQEA